MSEKQVESFLTVIIFTYNHKNSIAKAIENVINQKTNYKYEIHVCDDCSTDGTTEICREYAKNYPDKIKFFTQEKNTYNLPPKKRHFYLAYDRIQTKYWTALDGDDYLYSDDFVQTAISKLEEHPECSMFGGNSIWNNQKNGEANNYHKEMSMINLESGIYKEENVPFILPSARIYRSDFQCHKIIGQFDVYFFYYYLMKGSVYYDNRIMSVYNFDGNGIWSHLDDSKRILLDQTYQFRMCQILNFKREDLWLKLLVKEKDKKRITCLKTIFGKRLGWYIWFIFKFVPRLGWKVLNKNFIYTIK